MVHNVNISTGIELHNVLFIGENLLDKVFSSFRFSCQNSKRYFMAATYVDIFKKIKFGDEMIDRLSFTCNH